MSNPASSQTSIPSSLLRGSPLAVISGWSSTWLRPTLAVVALLALAVSIRDLERHTDSLAAFANALALCCLAVSAVALFSRRSLGLASGLILVVVVLGVLRSVVSLGGVPAGWTVTQTIDVRNRSAVSQSHIASIDFAAGDVPAHLVNDTRRFNFRGDQDDEPKRASLPVSMVASGYVVGGGELVVTSSSPIRITVGSEAIDLRPPIVDFHRGISVAQEEPVTITFAATGVDKASLQVRPVGTTVFSKPTAGPAMTVRRWLGQAAGILDLLTLAVSLAILLGWTRLGWRRLGGAGIAIPGLVGVVILLMVMPDVLTWMSQHSSLVVLTGGDDWLTYETFARDIRDNSLLMLQGKAPGTADAFYYQPLYPYVLALLHLLVGESVQGILVLQLLAVGLVILLAFLALPRNTATVVSFAVVGLGTGVFREWMMLAGRLLSENLLMVVLAALLFVVARLDRGNRDVGPEGPIGSIPSTRSMLLVGVLLGIAGLARSTSWLATPFILFVLLKGTPRHELKMRLLVAVVPIVVLAALVPARNIVAAGNPAILPTSGSVNLYLGNVPHGRKITSEPWLSLSKSYDPRLIAVAEAVVSAPDQVAQMVADKFVYVLGFPRSMDADNPILFWPILSLWLLAPLGLLSRQHSRLAWVAIILALAHVASLVVFFPNNYYYRLEMPATLPLALWDGIAVASVVNGVPNPSRAGWQARKLLSHLGANSSTDAGSQAGFR